MRPDRPGELRALFVAGVCHGFAGDTVQSTSRHRKCVARADEQGERHMKASRWPGSGEQRLAAGHLQESTDLFRESILLTSELWRLKGRGPSHLRRALSACM